MYNTVIDKYDRSHFSFDEELTFRLATSVNKSVVDTEVCSWVVKLKPIGN